MLDKNKKRAREISTNLINLWRQKTLTKQQYYDEGKDKINKINKQRQLDKTIKYISKKLDKVRER